MLHDRVHPEFMYNVKNTAAVDISTSLDTEQLGGVSYKSLKLTIRIQFKQKKNYNRIFDLRRKMIQYYKSISCKNTINLQD